MNPKIQRLNFFFLSSPLCLSIPAIKPMSPKLNICHGVQGPCPNIKLDTNADDAPTKNPDSAPKVTPAIIITAIVGLKAGTMKNIDLPITAVAERTAIIISSLACGSLFSNVIKNGTIMYIIISKLI